MKLFELSYVISPLLCLPLLVVSLAGFDTATKSGTHTLMMNYKRNVIELYELNYDISPFLYIFQVVSLVGCGL